MTLKLETKHVNIYLKPEIYTVQSTNQLSWADGVKHVSFQELPAKIM